MKWIIICRKSCFISCFVIINCNVEMERRKLLLIFIILFYFIAFFSIFVVIFDLTCKRIREITRLDNVISHPHNQIHILLMNSHNMDFCVSGEKGIVLMKPNPARDDQKFRVPYRRENWLRHLLTELGTPKYKEIETENQESFRNSNRNFFSVPVPVPVTFLK